MMMPPGTPADLLRLIAYHPLAWIVSHTDGGFDATPLPLLAETGMDGELVSLLGHYARRNPQVGQLRAAPRALVLFSGPHGYVSPELVSQPQWAPTWNYAVAAIAVDVEFVAEETAGAVGELVDTMEASRRAPWSMDQVGDRLEPMMAQIIAFRAHVRHVDARFKLGQDESLRSLSEILQGIDSPELAQWMRDFNAERLQDQGA